MAGIFLPSVLIKTDIEITESVDTIDQHIVALPKVEDLEHAFGVVAYSRDN